MTDTANFDPWPDYPPIEDVWESVVGPDGVRQSRWRGLRSWPEHVLVSLRIMRSENVNICLGSRRVEFYCGEGTAIYAILATSIEGRYLHCQKIATRIWQTQSPGYTVYWDEPYPDLPPGTTIHAGTNIPLVVPRKERNT